MSDRSRPLTARLAASVCIATSAAVSCAGAPPDVAPRPEPTAIGAASASAAPATSQPDAKPASAAPSAPPSSSAPKTDALAPPARPTGPLSLREAQRYALELINRDRAAHNLPPVTLDETASKAGARQASDLARHGYTAHIGTDGSNPELRHTEAGGSAMVMENVACFGDGIERDLDPDPTFSVAELERIEQTFIQEKPPADGHRRNILTPWHTSVGIGFAKAKDLDIVCLAQEFIDDYAKHDPLPATAKVGDVIKVSGDARAPATIAAVGVARVDKPKPQKTATLMAMHVYPIPAPYVTYFPKGFKTPIPLLKNGSAYSIEVPLSDRGKPGLYEVSVWANLPSTKQLVMISLRTIVVER